MMKNFIKNNLLPICILLAGLLISLSIYFAFNLDIIQKLFSIIGASSLGVALAVYFYNKNKDKTVAAIEQISFVRTEIIPKWDVISKLIRNKNPRYMFSRILLDELTLEFMKKQKNILEIFMIS